MTSSVCSSRRDIVVACLNPCLEVTMFGDFAHQGLSTADRQFYAPGGKGVNVARVIHSLGDEVKLVILSGGHIGAVLQALLAEDGLRPIVISCLSETRTSVVLVDPGGNRIFRAPGVALYDSSQDVAFAVNALLPTASFLCISGSIPSGVSSSLYGELVSLATGCEVPTIIDATGTALLAALSKHPFLSVLNEKEAEDLVGIKAIDDMAALKAVDAVITLGASNAIVMLGDRGVAARIHGETYFVTPPSDPVLCDIGAGDALVAGIATGLREGRSIADTLRWTVAIARSACLRPTSGVVGNMSELETIYAKVSASTTPRSL